MSITKALVVDDSKVAHLTLRKMLMERNIEVDWVGSGEESLAYLKQQKPDVVFMDVMMPGMDGFETLRAINQSPDIEKPVIIMCSANATNEDKNTASANGAVDFLSKPYTSHELDTILQRVSGSAAATVAPAQTPSEPAPSPALPTLQPEMARPAPAATGGAQAASPSVPTENIEEIARTAAEAVARKTAEVTLHAAKTASRGIAEEAARKIAEDMLHNHAPQQAPIDVDTLRGELQLELQRQLGAQVQTTVQQEIGNAVAEALRGDSVKQQLTEMVRAQTADLDSKASSAATSAVQKHLAEQGSDDTAANALKRASSAMTWAILAILLSLGAIGIIVAGIMGLI